MTPQEREQLVDRKAKQRAEIQGKISRLAAQREAFVQAEQKKRTQDSTKTLDDALIESAKAQAKKSDFTFSSAP
jgi:hypothetical protein